MNKANFITKDGKGNPLPQKGAANALILSGAKLQTKTKKDENEKVTVSDDSFKENLICVIEQDHRDVAYYVNDEARLNCLKSPDYATGDRVYLTLKNAEALAEN